MAKTIAEAVAAQQEEKLRLVRWHRQNACKRQGLPYEDASEPIEVKVDVSDAVKDALRPSAPSAPSEGSGSTPSPANPAQPSAPSAPSALSKALPWILAGLAGIGGSTAVNLLWPRGGRSSTTTIQAPEGDGSLLQWLEDQGEHLSNGGAN